jgi:trehalose/maltose hydrolase-like predicted phosphorylase
VDAADQELRAGTDTWRVPFSVTPANRRAIKSITALSNGYFGTRALFTPPDAHDDDMTVASGIYNEDDVPGLLRGPTWSRVDLDLSDTTPISGSLDLRRAVLETKIGDDGEVRAVQFVSADHPGVHAHRLTGPARTPGDGSPLQKPPDHEGVSVETERDSAGVVTMTVTTSRAGIGASACESQSHGLNGAMVTTRYAGFAASPDSPQSVGAASRTVLHDALDAGFDTLLRNHVDVWAQRWSAAAIDLPEQPALELAIRLAQFHLFGSCHAGDEAAVGARGLTGMAYRGHVFWDTDVFVVPALTAMAPKLASAALRYRHNRLHAAMDRAGAEGRDGARFPWESAADGTEVTPTEGIDLHGRRIAIRTGELEEHIVSDIAWAVDNHLNWTGDAVMHGTVGRDVLMQCARYWCSRIETDRDGCAHIRNVIGPDEYHEAVDDNAFTNVMARWTLLRAVEFSTGLDLVDDAERQRWRRMAERLVDGYDPTSGRHEQFAGYFDLDDMRASSIGEPPIPADVLLGHDRVNRTQIIKQPDVLMLHHLVPDAMPTGSLVADLDYYLPRTAHGSSLSPAITAANLARAGRVDEALRWFEMAARLDLDNITSTSGGGVHLATMGGVWQAFSMGFLGVRATPEALQVDPRIPESWGTLSHRFFYRNFPVQIRASNDRFTLTSAQPVRIVLSSGDTATQGAHRARATPHGWEFR